MRHDLGVFGKGHAPCGDHRVDTFAVLLDHGEQPGCLVGDHSFHDRGELALVACGRLCAGIGHVLAQCVPRLGGEECGHGLLHP
jgi:hypothetical protein